MKNIIQRVNSASVKVEGKIVGSIEKGILLLSGFGVEDTAINIQSVADKIVNMRIFTNEKGRFDHSLLELKESILVVPQFTLYADTSKGRRPEFFQAMPPKEAEVMFLNYLNCFKGYGLKAVESGIFGADMKVSLENDGPVTIILES
ncbi:MAG: D-tyrosyl-tRNA(Tyr) deacylase [Proteobacteria bacterium]|nr:D-tyrosyl-tRNA(Tyr) deacylase [Pseudomonadota bacterium]